MLIYDRVQAISVMNNLGAQGIPFVFLIDFEMKKIIISTKFKKSRELKFEMNGFRNHENSPVQTPDHYFESFPLDQSKYSEKFQIVKSEIQKGNSFLLNLSCRTKMVSNLTLNEIYNSTRAKYKIYLEDEFVCFSPEIFVQINDGRIASYPMKGDNRCKCC